MLVSLIQKFDLHEKVWIMAVRVDITPLKKQQQLDIHYPAITKSS